MTPLEIGLLICVVILLLAYQGAHHRGDQGEAAAKVALEVLSDLSELDPEGRTVQGLIVWKAKIKVETMLTPGGCDDKKT